jgi:hypothetical protein
LTQKQRLLLFGDASQLCHISLEKSNAEGQVNAHDPELGAAQEMAVCGICEQDLHQVDVQEERGCDGNLQVAYPDERRSSVPDETCDAGDECNRPCDSEACVQLSCMLSAWCSSV